MEEETNRIFSKEHPKLSAKIKLSQIQEVKKEIVATFL
jgi:hypothetical protein